MRGRRGGDLVGNGLGEYVDAAHEAVVSGQFRKRKDGKAKNAGSGVFDWRQKSLPFSFAQSRLSRQNARNGARSAV